MSTNIDASVTDLLAMVEGLIEPIDAPRLLRELDNRLESLVIRHESEAQHG